MIEYRVEMTPDDNGTLLVTCPDLPMVVTYGDERAGALRHAVDAIETALASMIDDREDIPLPALPSDMAGDYVRLPIQTELKVHLYRALRAAGLTRADLQRRLGWKRESVDRLFRLDHNSRLDQIEQAFTAIGRTVEIAIGQAA